MLKIVAAVKFYKGEINPFDASALEWAVSEKGAQVIVISMSPASVTPQAEYLTRLGAEVVLISDAALAGSDTLVTAKVLSEAIKRLSPDLVYCGRQSVDGDTAQVPAEIAETLGYDFIPYAMEKSGDRVVTRYGESKIKGKTVIAWEKTRSLRAASLRSVKKEVKIIGINELGLKAEETGFCGSPTKVVQTFESERGRRTCRFIKKEELQKEIEIALRKETPLKFRTGDSGNLNTEKLKEALIIGEGLVKFGSTIAERTIRIIPDENEPRKTAEKIRELGVKNVFFRSDPKNRVFAPRVAAILGAGLCADCVKAEVHDEKVYVYRPASEGKIIAKIESKSEYFLATIRDEEKPCDDIVFGIGYGAKDCVEAVKRAAERLNAGIVGTRKVVDNGILPYEAQTGLTGKTIKPKVYIAAGVGGAIQHIVGVEQAETIIAINADKNAKIFDYADVGVIGKAEDIFK